MAPGGLGLSGHGGYLLKWHLILGGREHDDDKTGECSGVSDIFRETNFKTSHISGLSTRVCPEMIVLGARPPKFVLKGNVKPRMKEPLGCRVRLVPCK